MHIRQALEGDVSRIAEILVFNNRVNFWPIFQDAQYSFGEMQVMTIANNLLRGHDPLANTWVYDDGIIKGFLQVEAGEIQKLYVDTFFQGAGVGAALIAYAITQKQAEFVWALEKNTRAIRFYNRHGFFATGERTFEDGTTEYLIKLKRR